MANELVQGFTAAMESKSDRRTPATPGGAASQFGWSARDIAQRMNVSERTARRWRQQDRIPERRRGDWRDATAQAAQARTRGRMQRRGLSGLSVQGEYRVSRSKYRTHPDASVRVMGGSHISGSAMRDVFERLDAGDVAGANQRLEDELAGAYGVPRSLTWESVDSVEFRIR